MTPPSASIEDIVFHVSNALRVPVLIAALLALALALIELGRLGVELGRRRRRDPLEIERAARAARAAIAAGDPDQAKRHLVAVAASRAMVDLIDRVLAELSSPPVDDHILHKSLADFDLASLRRLERTRVLVRAGPALGLMGTLIPLSPALSGLASGNVGQLTANLRVAFSVTVLGLLVGVIAFGVSLVRDRVYAQDLSDVEFMAAEIEVGAADAQRRPSHP